MMELLLRYLYAVPLLFSLINLFIVLIGGSFIVPVHSETANFTTFALCVFVILMGCSTISAYISYFAKDIRNSLAWVTIVVSGLLSIATFALLYAHAGIICGSNICLGSGLATFGGAETAHLYSDFSTGLYFSIVTFTTLGYGDLQPIPAMRMIAAIQALFGYVYLGLFVGVATHCASNRIN